MPQRGGAQGLGGGAEALRKLRKEIIPPSPKRLTDPMPEQMLGGSFCARLSTPWAAPHNLARASAKDFASYESYKRAGILYVFPPFITARMGQKIGRRPQTQLCGDALALEWLFVRAAPVMLLAALVALILLRKRKSDCQKTSLKTCVTEQRGVCAGGKKPTARSIKQDFETFLKVSKSAQRGEKTFSTR